MEMFTNTHERFVIRESEPERMILEVGLTRHGANEIGDVEQIEFTTGDFKSADVLCTLDWTGFKITEADELYHTIWENAEGKREISLPLDGRILEVNTDVVSDPEKASEEDWLFRVIVDSADFRRLPANFLVNRTAYDAQHDGLMHYAN